MESFYYKCLDLAHPLVSKQVTLQLFPGWSMIGCRNFYLNHFIPPIGLKKNILRLSVLP